MTDEFSGHYGDRWTPELRQQFIDFMRSLGLPIEHTPW
jgi:large repetitive protein